MIAFLEHRIAPTAAPNTGIMAKAKLRGTALLISKWADHRLSRRCKNLNERSPEPERNTLDYMKDKKHIKGYIAGEHFTRKEGQTRALLRRLPHMADDVNLNRNNRGVTLVEV